ncbi:helix-turn-helix domain-containing protein [Microbacterium sp. Leaf436]|uniref:helix-turn-helix domain-containing protein n=1 Tax=Microbacterium sp. Leaf436 TaxID=1736377 RepID=UPI0012E36065|nr:helix-turn-helix domain-containing protein [Microbacterium sp. Leaf436]
MTGARVVADDELVWWALTVPIPETSHRIGEDRMNRVLAALAMHANIDRIAWPSSESLGKSLSLNRRTVRNVFDALVEAKLIERTPSRSRSTAWRILAPVASILATSRSADMARILATGPVDNSSRPGELTGEPTGELTGEDPRHEEKRREKNRNLRNNGVTSIDSYRLPAKTLVTTQPGEYCPPGQHRILGDGTCMNCEMRPERGSA